VLDAGPISARDPATDSDVDVIEVMDAGGKPLAPAPARMLEGPPDNGEDALGKLDGRPDPELDVSPGRPGLVRDVDLHVAGEANGDVGDELDADAMDAPVTSQIRLGRMAFIPVSSPTDPVPASEYPSGLLSPLPPPRLEPLR
jgi:hypothetical protein